MLFVWGAISFHQLPVEAYPDVANNYVEIITQWPGISAEQIEQQVTIPLEIVMNGIPHMVHLRSFSLFGLSDMKADFRRRGGERLEPRAGSGAAFASHLAARRVVPQMGTDWSPVGQIYFFTLHSTNPQYDVMELKSLEDWVVEKNFKAVPNIVDVASFGGPRANIRFASIPKADFLRTQPRQVEQQLTNNNANAGGSFIEAGLQQINIREVGWSRTCRTSKTRSSLTKNGTPLRVKDIAVVAQGPKIRLGQFARAIHREDGKIIDNDDVVSASCCCAKAPTRTRRCRGSTQKWRR
jgi:heavy metal efflux system protein